MMFDIDDQIFQTETLEKGEGFQYITHDILDFKSLKEIDNLLIDNPKIDLLLDFWAEGCEHCREFSSTFESLYKEYKKHFIFAKVKIGQDKRILYKYKITSVPTCIIIKNGKLAYMHTSVIDYLELKEILEMYKKY